MNDFLIASFSENCTCLLVKLEFKAEIFSLRSSWITTRLTLLLKKNEGCKASIHRVFIPVFVNY